MATTFLISGNGTGVGKTYVTLMLLEELARRGYRVGVMKPVETGLQGLKEGESDGELLLKKVRELNPAFQQIQLEDISPFRFQLPASPAVAGRVNPFVILQKYRYLRKYSEIILVEGAGGLLVPLTESLLILDLLFLLSAQPVLVFGSRLGVINDFHLNRAFLESRGIEYLWGINLMDESYWEITHPYLQRFNPLFFQLNLPEIVDRMLEMPERG